MKAYSKKTGALVGTATVISVSKGQRAKCQFQTALAAGEYTLEIATCGLAGETTPRIFRKGVTVLAGETPTGPTITKVKQEGKADNTIVLATTTAFTIEGTNLGQQSGDALWMELYDEGGTRLDEGDLTEKVESASSTSTLITLTGLTWNMRQPDGSWLNAYPRTKIVIVRGSNRVEFPMTFVGS